MPAAVPPFHLLLAADEVPVLATALNLLIAAETHDVPVRPLAREVLPLLDAAPDEHGIVSVPLSPPQMKVADTAAKIRFDDTRREQAGEREVLRSILDKLPDEHTMRAIALE
ncbi:MAG: hypothetical protein R2725_11640 [Solirubrobacterales bacterium]